MLSGFVLLSHILLFQITYFNSVDYSRTELISPHVTFLNLPELLPVPEVLACCLSMQGSIGDPWCLKSLSESPLLSNNRGVGKGLRGAYLG